MLVKLMYAVATCLLSCFPCSIALGCMYTVRDVGFVDVGSVPYRLYCYIQNDTPENLISTFNQISYAALMDSNVEVQIINVERQKANPDRGANAIYDTAMRYLDFWELQSFPAAILVSPKGQSLVLPIFSMLDARHPPRTRGAIDGNIQHPASSIQYRELWSTLENIVISPKRKEILSSIAKAYCVVLLIQGEDAVESKRAQEAVRDAIQEISRIISQMPKSIEEPPRLIVIPPELFSRERVLLWSLGMTREQGGKGEKKGRSSISPAVALLYGRGRQIGHLLRGSKITVNRVFNILSVIGESCECGLDRGWVLGTMLPLRWDEKIQSGVVKLLGFDPESPMVKMEISQILSMGSSLADGQAPVPAPKGSTLEEYSEVAVELESGPAVARLSPAQFRQLVSREPAASGMGFHRRFKRRAAFLIVGGMVLLILAGGIFIILQARRRAS